MDFQRPVNRTGSPQDQSKTDRQADRQRDIVVGFQRSVNRTGSPQNKTKTDIVPGFLRPVNRTGSPQDQTKTGRQAERQPDSMNDPTNSIKANGRASDAPPQQDYRARVVNRRNKKVTP